MASLKDAALAYARKGWPVFPCKADKTPYTERGVLEATTNPRQVEEWWEQYPRANIGCDVGGAGMVVLDLDPGHDWDEIEAALGGEPDTHLIQRTPRGGEHLFFTIGQGEVIPPSAGKIAPHVDVRSHHSYVLLAPSRTKDGEYTWDEQGKPAHRPQGLYEWAQESHRKRSEDHDDWIIEADLPENIAQAIKYLKTEAQIAIEGSNGDSMAYRTAAMCKSYGLSPETAFDVMWEHWNPRCVPPWDADEAEHFEQKIVNAYSYNTSPPGNLTEAYKVAKHQQLFKPVSRDTTSGGRASEAGRFRFVDERGVEDIKPPEWLIEGAIPQQAYAMLIGPRSTYKTFVALDMALSIATGGASWYEDEADWRGVWPNITASGPVLFAAGEGRAGFKSRVASWRSYHIDGDFTNNFFLVDPVPHPTEDDVTAFIQGALSLSDYYELVVLDTVGRAMQGLNENSQQDASQFTLMVQTIQQELECAVLAIHHTGHGIDDRARGSSVFGADLDVEFIAKLDSKRNVALFNTKQKDAPEIEGPTLIHLATHKGSLVATKPSKRDIEQAKEDAKHEEVSRDTKGKHQRGGRKTQEAFAVELSVVRTAAYQAMKVYPGKEWTKAALASAIAADERVSVAAGTIRNRYMDELLTDKAHPVAGCYDIGKQTWSYKP